MSGSMRERIQSLATQFTGADRRLATIVLVDYPYGGLVGIRELAQRSEVSVPSVTRFVSKLGCAGYQEFQRSLLNELRESQRGPTALHETEALPKGSSLLDAFTNRISIEIRRLPQILLDSNFEETCEILADPSRSVFILGGRVSRTIAEILAIHLRYVRRNVYFIEQDTELWPNYLESIKRNDVVVLYDFRRYQDSVFKFGELAKKQKNPTIISITDQWLSPTTRYSDRTFALPISIGTPWDSLVAPIVLTEAIIANVTETRWKKIEPRLKAWEILRGKLSHAPTSNEKEAEGGK